jgi:hypothetical protein
MLITRQQFSDFFLSTMKPALEQVIWNRYQRFPQQWTKIFDQDTTKLGIYQTSGISGIGLFSEITEGGDVTDDAPVQGFDKTFTPRRFGKAIRITQDVMEDDAKLRLSAKQGVMLSNAAKETLEIFMASDFNNGFTAGAYAGPDAVALFSASHPLTKAGGVQSNILSVAADLDVTSLELALTDYRTMLNAEGAHVMLPKPRVIVAPANQWNAIEILASKMRSDTANNTANAFRESEDGAPDWLVWDYLTDPDAWFLVANPADTGLLVVWTRKPYTRSWIEDRSENAILAMRYKVDHGWSDFYGTYGTPGA